jgi:hypothetical protein
MSDVNVREPLGFVEMVEQFEMCPVTYLPGLLAEIVKACESRNVFRSEVIDGQDGMDEFYQRMRCWSRVSRVSVAKHVSVCQGSSSECGQSSDRSLDQSKPTTYQGSH